MDHPNLPPALKRVVFLDRDGTINVDHGHVHERTQWEFLAQVPAALRLLQDAGFALAVVTNQAGVAAGRYPEQDVVELHAHMMRELADHGVTLAAVVYCPHARDARCSCRKPAPGLARQVEQIVGAIDYPHSWVIGDKASDVEFGHNLGARTAFIRSRYAGPGPDAKSPDMKVDSLHEFALAVTSQA